MCRSLLCLRGYSIEQRKQDSWFLGIYNLVGVCPLGTNGLKLRRQVTTIGSSYYGHIVGTGEEEHSPKRDSQERVTGLIKQ